MAVAAQIGLPEVASAAVRAWFNFATVVVIAGFTYLNAQLGEDN